MVFFRARYDEALRSRRIGWGFGLNQQLYDFGLSARDIHNSEAQRNLIEFIDSNFALVMIVERMEESLVLLADKLCWPLHYVATLKLNARSDQFKVSFTPLGNFRII